MWNDTDTHLALFISIRCRGTWLHGDERGSIDRNNNIFGSPRIAPNERWKKYNLENLVGEPVYLDAARRRSVKTAIIDTCEKRGWHLHGHNVRTNHFHIVVGSGAAKPPLVLHAFKANATRQMRQDGVWPFDYTPWVDKGSRRLLWSERSIANALEYVLNGQGDDLPYFE